MRFARDSLVGCGRISYRSGLAFMVLVALGAPTELKPQAVLGTVVDAGSREPVPQAHVVLLDTDLNAVSGVLSDDRGAFFVRAPRPGTYSLRVERIGFASTDFDAMARKDIRLPDAP